MKRLRLNLDRPFNGNKPDLGYATYVIPKSWNPSENDEIEVNVKGFMVMDYVIEDIVSFNPEFVITEQEMILKSTFGIDLKWILQYLKDTYHEDRFYIIGCRSLVTISSPTFIDNKSNEPAGKSYSASTTPTKLPNRSPRIYSKSTKQRSAKRNS